MKLSRRHFMQLTAGFGAAGFGFDAQAHPDGFGGTLPAIVDSSVHCQSEVAKLKKMGVKVIVRYFAKAKQGGGLEQKILEKPEADAILDGGLSLAISYQYNNGDIDTFNPTRATEDVLDCIKKADAIGQPKGSAIYFGVDNGWDDATSIGKVKEYFQTIKDVLKKNGNRFEVGVYGSGLMCQTMREKHLASYSWIAGLSDGWPGRPDYLATQKWNLYQNVLEFPVGSVKVDTDVVNPKAAKIGSFHRTSHNAPAVLDGEITDPASLANYRLIAGNGNKLTDRPGGTVLKSLVASKMVRVVADAGDYTQIDVPQQIADPHGGQIADFTRGYCPTRALERIDSFTS